MTNRLVDETSPYLLQHADNPVDWYPWGSEALERAAGEDKPLLISIGYAACHWCHVMAHESFEDPEVAEVMNQHFVNVKVDREERPDVDAIYMGAVQALTGHGGWPMTIFATPDGTPFLGGTYFPPTDRQGMPSFRTVLERVDELWRTRRDDLFEQGNKLLDALRRSAPAPSKEPLGSNLLVGAATQIMRAHDAGNGGFGEAPKFPQAPVLELLLRIDARTTTARRAAPSKRDQTTTAGRAAPSKRDQTTTAGRAAPSKRDQTTTAGRAAPSKRDQSGRPKEALELTLRKMALGGIYDQLGGGFHRYTVDAEWVVPHFEKMLYDNAQLARVYTHAWQAYGDPLYHRIATETLDYLLRDMRDDAGGFHSSEDADSEGEEGKFYVFSYGELMAIAPEAADHYAVSEAGNFEGANILVASGPEPPAEARARLLEARERRVRPGRDDKVLASWNGLVIAALAEAGAAFDRSDLIEAAAATAEFILSSMTADGRLLHTFRDGRAKIPAFLEDHAYLADGLLSLWEATFDPRWLEAAERLAREALERFGAENGALYTASEEHDGLVVRQTEVVESAIPAPGAVLAIALQRLAHLFDDTELRSRAAGALRIARLYMDRAPQAAATWLAALDFYVATPKEIAFTGPIADEAGRRLRSVVDTRYLPNRVMAADADGLSSRVALLADKPTTDEATAYVCERYVCQAPTSDPDELARQLA